MPPKTKTKSVTSTKLALATAALLAASSLAFASIPLSEKDKDYTNKETVETKKIYPKKQKGKKVMNTKKQPIKKVTQTTPSKLQKFCANDYDCEVNQICENRQCKEIEQKYCSQSQQCGEGKICENSRCRAIERMKIVTIRESDETNYRSNNNVSIGQANNSSNTRPVIGPTGGTWRWFSESKNTSERFYGSNWTPYNDRNFVIVTITGDIEEQTLSFLADIEDRYGNVQENKQINIYLPEIDTENSNVPCNADHCSPFTFRNQESLVILLVDEFGSTYYLPVVDTPYFEEEDQDGEWVQGRAHYTDWNTALSEEYIARRGLVPHNNRGFQISG